MFPYGPSRTIPEYPPPPQIKKEKPIIIIQAAMLAQASRRVDLYRSGDASNNVPIEPRPAPVDSRGLGIWGFRV